MLSGLRSALARERERTPLAWRNLTHRKAALVVSATAVGFAVLIMFTQIGFLNGLYDSQTNLLRRLRADLVIASSAQHMLVIREELPRERLAQARGVAGVAGVAALQVEEARSFLRLPDSGVERAIRVIACDPREPVFEHAGLEAALERLRLTGDVAFDRRSRGYFGSLREGVSTELGGRQVRVAATFGLGADYYYDGNLLASEETFFSLFPHKRRERARLGLVRLDPAADALAVRDALRARLGPGVSVETKRDVIAREEAAWRRSTPAGYMFGLGVVIGYVIGVVFCYQILYTDIADKLPQLATLRALGFEDRALAGLVIRQALLLGLLGFAPALLASIAVYETLSGITGIVMELTFPRALLVLALTIAMCALSGLLAARKALLADPAELF